MRRVPSLARFLFPRFSPGPSLPLLAALLFAGQTTVPAEERPPTVLDLNELAFFHGREYFVLRSGRAQMIVQADRADLGPAVTLLLFDAGDARQSAAKEGALNFVLGEGFGRSALVVELGGFPFTALGHRTQTCWALEGGIPCVEAVWWAGGVRVTERIVAFKGAGAFLRKIRLEGAHLVGEEAVKVRLSLPPLAAQLAQQPQPALARPPAQPPGTRRAELRILAQASSRGGLALAALGGVPATMREAEGTIEIGPVDVAPGASVEMEAAIVVQILAGGAPGDVAEILERARALIAGACERERQETARHWATVSSVKTEDRVVEGIFDRARYGLEGMVADDGTMNAGIFEYGAQWVRDTSNTIIGAIHAGHFELARSTLQRILTTMVTKDGVTMIAGAFEEPDREQFDQMGELLHALKSYRDWTGEDSVLREHRELLVAMVERPLHPRFRDETGMVHNRREFWERTFDDAYELAYQTWVIQGLRDAADLAPALGAEDRAARWRLEADRILQAVLSHPTRALVAGGRLVKRRNLTGEVAEDPGSFPGFHPDVPLRSEKRHRILPDATQALPVALGIVEGRTDIALRTLDELDGLWNTRWSDGGYDRYHTSSQPDQPGPWSFATCFILRAQHEARLFDRSRRSLEWLNSVQGGRTGSWFEEISSVRSQSRTAGIIPWTSGEIALFVVRHLLGVRFDGDTLLIRPALYPGSPPASADLRFRKGRIRIEIDGSGPIHTALVNGAEMKPSAGGSLRLPLTFAGGTVVIRTAGQARG